MTLVQRQFVDVGGRRVHLRFAGRGPAMVLLHQSPQSSAALLPWIEALATDHAVFAPDTPGFGHSDPLPLTAPDIRDYAQALTALLDVLGLQKVLLCGVHTGAAIAAELAFTQPQRVAALVCDGLSMFDEGEQAALLERYLPPFEPQWDGGHLRWLFARLREQHLYFPWFDGRPAARLAYPLPTPPRLRDAVLDVLDAGDGYRLAYRAAFCHQPQAGLARLAMPARVCYRAADVLAPHATRCPPLPAGARLQVCQGGEPELRAAMHEVFASAAAAATPVVSASVVQRAVSNTRCIVPAGGIEWAFTMAGAGGVGDPAGPALLALGDLGQPAVLPDSAAASLRLAADWPGHGASGGAAIPTLTADTLAASLRAALQTLPLPPAPLALQARGAATALASALARQCGAGCTAPRLEGAPPASPAARQHFLQGLPALQPDGHGGWLLEAWDWVRGASLFDRWSPAVGLVQPAPDPWRVHQQVREVLRAGPLHTALWRAMLAD